MESDRRVKDRQLQKGEYGVQENPDGNYGYHTETHIKQNNILHEESKRIKTTKRNLNIDPDRTSNMQYSTTPAINNERYFNPNRIIEQHFRTPMMINESSKQKGSLSGFSRAISNRTDIRSPNTLVRYNKSDYDKEYTMDPNTSEATNQGNRKLYQLSNFDSPQFSNNVKSQTIKDTSLICRVINFHGEPVTVNDKVIKDKFILSCDPEVLPQNVPRIPEVLIGKQQSSEKYVTNYDICSGKSTRDPRSLQQNIKIENQSFSATLTSTVKTGQTREKYDPTNLSNKNVHIKDSKLDRTTREYYEYKQLKEIECRHIYSSFKGGLWCLFVDSILLLVVGILLTFLALSYIIFKEYLSIVIGKSGFVSWIKIIFIIALFIVIVGIVGIITSLVRTKPMLKTYSVFAIILLMIIILIIAIFLVQYKNLQKSAMRETDKTFQLYRCVRHIRVAWDTMMEKFQCCGKDSSSDWKYVPPACCKATIKAEKLACIGHFIQLDQAYKNGCKVPIFQYYFILYLIVLIMLLFAILLLIIGIYCSFRLYQMYCKILICHEEYCNR